MGKELAQEKDFSVTPSQADFSGNAKLLHTPPSLWAGRKELLSMDYIKLRQRKLGELRWVAAVSRPDICARLARIASRVSALCGSDMYRINELVRAEKDGQQATAPKYALSSQPSKGLGWGGKVQGALRKGGERVHGGSMTLAGW